MRGSKAYKELLTLAKKEPDRILMNEDDLWYRFAENFLHIIDVEGRSIPFVPKKAQRRFLETYFTARREKRQFKSITCKARQIGWSTMCVQILLVQACLTPHSEILLAAQLKDGPAQNIYNKYIHAIRNMPMNKHKRDAQIFAVGGSPGSGRMQLKNNRSTFRLVGERIEVGSTLSGAHISEAAHYTDFAEFMKHLRPAIRTGDRKTMLIESTARAYGDAFHEEFLNAEDGRGDWEAFFSPWFEDETYQSEVKEPQKLYESLSKETERYGDELDLMTSYNLTLEQLQWRRDTIDEGRSLATFQMNYPCTANEAFLSADRPVFHVPSLNWYREQCRPPESKGFYETEQIGLRPTGSDPFIFKAHHLGTVEVWEPPQDDQEYVWAADVAEGIPSGDFSVALLAKRTPFEVVAKIRGDDTTKLDIKAFARELAYLIRHYGDARGLPELNNHGHAVVELLNEWGLGHTMMYEADVFKDTTNFKRQGFLTNPKSKAFLFDTLTDVVRVDKELNRPTQMFAPLVPDIQTIMELYSIVTDGRKIQARNKGEHRTLGDNRAGFHDDLAVCLGLLVLAQMSLPTPKNPQTLLVQKYGRNHPRTFMFDDEEIEMYEDPIAAGKRYVR